MLESTGEDGNGIGGSINSPAVAKSPQTTITNVITSHGKQVIVIYKR